MKISISVKLGVAAGLINCIAWYGFAKSLSFYAVEVYVYRNYVTLALLVIGVFLSVFLKKRNDGGFMEFKNAIKTGLIYSLVLAVILAIFNYIYYYVITPDTIDYFLSEAKKSMLEMAAQNKIKATDIPKYLEGERSNFSSFKLIPPILFFGIISSLLAGGIFHKKDPLKLNEN